MDIKMYANWEFQSEGEFISEGLSNFPKELNVDFAVSDDSLLLNQKTLENGDDLVTICIVAKNGNVDWVKVSEFCKATCDELQMQFKSLI